MRAFVRQHAVLSFVVLAYTLSWVAWVPLLVRNARVVPGGSVTHFPGLLGPAIASFVIVALIDGAGGVRRLLGRMVLVSKPTLAFFAYSLSPVAFLVLALLVLAIAGSPLPSARDFAVYSGLPVLSLPVVLSLVLLFTGYGEETGWRGFALGPLQQRYGPVRGTLVLALIWAGWHIPAFWFVEGYRALGVAGMIGGFGLGIIAGALVLARVLNRTDGSVLAAVLWHATYNLTSATAASRGIIGAVTTTCVMLWAALLLIMEWRRPLERSRLAILPVA
jgi:membrane protease YdiL (CAAX protease family)